MRTNRGQILAAMAGLVFLGAALAAAAGAGLFAAGWLRYKRLERSIVAKMDQYYLDITTPDREEYLLADDEIFEVPYMASKLSVQSEPTRIYDARDRVIGEYVADKGLYVRSPDDIPLLMRRALVATEDGTFYQHRGVNYRAFARAMWINLRSRRFAQGGSTLTQQLAKLMFTTRKKTAGRKIFEFFAARKLEEKFTKDQILLMYLNFANFGHGCYGLESAARFYFDKSATDLSLGEAAMLAGIIASPENYSPFVNADLTKARMRTALSRMAKNGFIPESSAAREFDDFWAAQGPRFGTPEVSFWRMTVNKAPAFIEYVRRELAKEYSKDRIMRGGLRVRTTLDLELQEAASRALHSGLKALNDEVNNASDESDRIEGGAAAVRPSDGAILALVGGSAFNFNNQLNRAVDISRAIGSTVKPFIFAEAFTQGFGPQDTMVDEPRSYKMERGKRWTPRNYEGKYYGQVTLAQALQKSLNSIAVELLIKAGLDRVISLLSAATGQPKESFPRNLSLALGTAQSSPLRLAAAYALFANGGRAVEPYFLRSIEDREGKVIKGGRLEPAKKEPLLAPEAVRLAQECMRGVLAEGGTAHAAAKRASFTIPAAAKTGTTNDYKDAWFAGVTPDVSAAVWVGYDDMRLTLGKTGSGGHAAAPIWMRFIKEAYRDRPTREFDMTGVNR
ncbi:MAG: PBP1A family penicillin-binding protein [Elusimicrobia bacterium]|nr:PBP1A family penicillin-binding protein [Elusimicrobiota bacterium]